MKLYKNLSAEKRMMNMIARGRKDKKGSY